MRIGYSSRGGPFVSMGCLGWTLLILIVIGLAGWLVSAVVR